MSTAVVSVSVVIPVRNDRAALGVLLSDLAAHAPATWEVVVVDGGSTDRTAERATRAGHQPVSSPPGRGRQQHTGARAATGDILLFLHCDTTLPLNFTDLVKKNLRQKGVAAGAFKLAINERGAAYRLIEFGANLRSRILQLPYGDQALFMKRDTYFAAGGFPDLPILEEIAILPRLKKHGRIVIAPACAVTSARRWQRHGTVKTTVINQLMLAGWAMVISADRLARWCYSAVDR